MIIGIAIGLACFGGWLLTSRMALTRRLSKKVAGPRKCHAEGFRYHPHSETTLSSSRMCGEYHKVNCWRSDNFVYPERDTKLIALAMRDGLVFPIMPFLALFKGLTMLVSGVTPLTEGELGKKKESLEEATKKAKAEYEEAKKIVEDFQTKALQDVLEYRKSTEDSVKLANDMEEEIDRLSSVSAKDRLKGMSEAQKTTLARNSLLRREKDQIRRAQAH